MLIIEFKEEMFSRNDTGMLCKKRISIVMRNIKRKECLKGEKLYEIASSCNYVHSIVLIVYNLVFD